MLECVDYCNNQSLKREKLKSIWGITLEKTFIKLYRYEFHSGIEELYLDNIEKLVKVGIIKIPKK